MPTMAKEEINYITPLGFKRLQDELEHLIKVERPQVTQLVTWAASNGDRSENADYQYGKRRLREIDRRIRFLSKRLDLAQVVDRQGSAPEKVQFGATVRVSDEEGEERTYTIVGVDEVNTQLAHISWRSPIGTALIGKEVGNTVLVKTPKGDSELEILEILYRPIS